MNNIYDVIIVGGGIVGLLCAIGLSEDAGLSIALLEEKPKIFNANGFNRVSAITLASQRVFENLNLWDAICQHKVSPFKQIKIWDNAFTGEIDFESKLIGEPQLGYIIENQAMEASLYEKLQTIPNIHLMTPIQLINLSEDQQHIILHAQNGNQFKGSLAIAADGMHSWLRQQMHIMLDQYDYGEVALVANVRTTQPHEKIARQFFLKTGPLAFLPLLEDCFSSIVWTLPKELAEEYSALNENDFKKKINETISIHLGTVEEISERYAFPLTRQKAFEYHQSRVVLLGDAAHTVHPLAGQGVNMGILDAASLIEIISDARRQGRNIADIQGLKRYARWRKADNLMMQKGIDMIHAAFKQQSKPFSAWRAFGMNKMNRSLWLKKYLIAQACGKRNGLPQLATKLKYA